MTETVLLLPGLMCDQAIWEHQSAALRAAGHQVLIPDFRGLDSLRAMAGAALALTEGPVAVAGHSMGGRAAIETWALAPDRVKRLALLDTAAHPTGPGEQASRMGLVEKAKTQGMAAALADWLPPMLAPDHRDDQPLVKAMTEMLMRTTPEDFGRQQHALLTRRDLRPVLRTIAVPTVFATGRFDAHAPVEQHEAMAALVPGHPEVRVFEEAGHMAPAEMPEAVSAFLLGWMKRG